MKLKNLVKLAVVTFSSLNLFGCGEGLIISPTYDGGIVIKSDKKSPPRIRSLDYYPKTTARKDDVITFTVDASNNKNEALQYSWKTSKGTLLSNSGNTVSWKPVRGDGVLETGIATITVTVSDGGLTVDASANVFISSDGRVSNSNSNYDNSYDYQDTYPTPYPTSYRPYTPAPTPYTDYRDYDDYSYQSRGVIFQDNFESGFLDDSWNISYPGSTRKSSYLTWKKLTEDTNTSNHVVVLTGPTDFVLANTCDSEVRLTSQAIDLRNVKLPRLTFDAKSFANPVTSVKLNVYWSSEGRTPRALNVSFIPDKNWNEVDVDLQNLLSEEGGSVGLLTIGAVICNNKNEFNGPMIDNIKIFDAAR